MALRLLCITAHPDDESGAFGGALLLAHARGAETGVICLTEGRAASRRGGARTPEELARMRRAEFAAALQVLGVTHGEVLGYPDGALSGENFLEIATLLVERIRSFRPQIVLTFGGDGGVNQHPDHTMASCFATAAFHWAGRSAFAPEHAGRGLAPFRPQKLYYWATPFLSLADSAETARVPVVPPTLTLELGPLKEQKLLAFAQHSTQAALLTTVRDAFEKHGGTEKYLLAARTGFHPAPLEGDMFEGIEDRA